MRAHTLGAIVFGVGVLAASGAVRANSSDSSRVAPVILPTYDTLPARAQCYIDAFRRDSLPGASCMIACIQDGSGFNIAGGCWHICYAYSGVPMPRSERFAQCPAPTAEPTSPKPEATCRRSVGKREIRVRLVDASSGSAVGQGTVFRRHQELPFVSTDSLGELTVSVASADSLELIGGARGYAYAFDTISVARNTVCEVVMRLSSARGYGF